MGAILYRRWGIPITVQNNLAVLAQVPSYHYLRTKLSLPTYPTIISMDTMSYSHTVQGPSYPCKIIINGHVELTAVLVTSTTTQQQRYVTTSWLELTATRQAQDRNSHQRSYTSA